MSCFLTCVLITRVCSVCKNSQNYVIGYACTLRHTHCTTTRSFEMIVKTTSYSSQLHQALPFTAGVFQISKNLSCTPSYLLLSQHDFTLYFKGKSAVVSGSIVHTIPSQCEKCFWEQCSLAVCNYQAQICSSCPSSSRFKIIPLFWCTVFPQQSGSCQRDY